MIRYLITDGTAATREAAWLAHLNHWLELGVEYIQIRERNLDSRHLTTLTRKVIAARQGKPCRILVNDRADVALASGADGVHLRDGSPPPSVFVRPRFLISASCHDPASVPGLQDADLIILAPVFHPLSKPARQPPLGLEGLSKACSESHKPVLALGGITANNSASCLDAGASGIAGISFFHRMNSHA